MMRIILTNVKCTLILFLSVFMCLFRPAVCQAENPSSLASRTFQESSGTGSLASRFKNRLSEFITEHLTLKGYPINLTMFVKDLEKSGFRNSLSLDDLSLPLDGKEYSAEFDRKKAIVKFNWIVVDFKKIKRGECAKWETKIYCGPIEAIRLQPSNNRKDKREPVPSFTGTPYASRFNIHQGSYFFFRHNEDSIKNDKESVYLLLQKVADVYCDEGVGNQHRFVYRKRFFQPVFTPLIYRRLDERDSKENRDIQINK